MTNSPYYLPLVLAQMVFDGLSTSTVQFFKAIYPTLANTPYLNTTEMGELASMSQVAAAKHVKTLTRNGYLTRRHRCAWVLSERPLRKPELVHLLRVSNGIV